MASAPVLPPTHKTLIWRSRLVFGGIILIWLILAGRLVQLQVIERDELYAITERQHTVSVTIPARPGDIVDRHGRLLATTVTAKSLFVDPQQLTSPWQTARQLAAALDLDADDLFLRFAKYRQKRFLWVKRRLSESEVRAIANLKLPKSVFGFRDEYLRKYPQGRLAAHVIGLRNIDGVGRGGIEQTFDGILRGQNGTRLLTRDAHGKVVQVREEVTSAPKHGRTVVLAIDAVIQLYVERELDRLVNDWSPRGASCIVMDPRNGELLAMASRPGFDLNNPRGTVDLAWRNNTIASMYEPGSTLKPFLVAAAIDGNVLQANETLNCEFGAYRMGRRVLHDHHSYGELSVTDVLVKSSNIGMAKIGERLTNAGLHTAVLNWGFGRKTGIELPGEVSGVVRPLHQWDHYSTGSVPMGHEIAVTPLQLISAHAALANGGHLLTPKIVLTDTALVSNDYQSANDRNTSTQVASVVARRDTTEWLVRGPMREVITRGTGRNGKLDGYTVFGKTGTAQKPDPKTGKISSQLHVASFVCGAPAEEPRVLVLVVVDEPSGGPNHYGGTVAAPSAAKLLRQTLIHLRVPGEISTSRD